MVKFTRHIFLQFEEIFTTRIFLNKDIAFKKFWYFPFLTFVVSGSRMYRSSRFQLFFKIGILKNFAIFTGRHFCWSLFNKVAGLQGCNIMIRRLQHRCFPLNIAKKFRLAFYIEQLCWLLLNLQGVCLLTSFVFISSA